MAVALMRVFSMCLSPIRPRLRMRVVAPAFNVWMWRMPDMNGECREKSLQNTKLFYQVNQIKIRNPKGYKNKNGTLSAFCAVVGGYYDIGANAGVFNVNVNNSSSNTNTNNGAHHRGIISAFTVPCHLAEIHKNSWQMNNLPTPYHEVMAI